MSQTFEGVPPRLPPAPDIPGNVTPDQLMASIPSDNKSAPNVQAEVARATRTDMPVIEEAPLGTVHLPAGWISPEGLLVREAIVRELNGFDEERLSRLGMTENPAEYVTEMLALGVEDLGGERPSKDVLRELLIGDRDALWLGIRIATYGRELEYKLDCTQCENESVATIDLYDDVPVKEMDDPLKREFDVELRHGVAKLVLLNGFAQEKFSKNLGKKTQAEINTIMLANSVIAINDVRTKGEDSVRRLGSQDRATLMDFIVEHQPGPQLSEEIIVHCATCNAPFPIILSQASMFRF
jgi:hypothetical protein